MTTTKSLMIAANPAQSGEGFALAYTAFGDTVFDVSAETQTNFPCLTAFTLSFLGLQAAANNTSGAVTYKSRINSVNGNCTLTVPLSGTGWFSDTTHSDSVTSGQNFNVVRNSGNVSTFNPKLTIITGVASATSPILPQIVADGTGHSGQFQPPFGGFNLNGVAETAAQEIISAAATWKGFGLKTAAAATSTNTSTTRQNGANGNQTISITNGTASGTAVQDTTHTDSVANGDNLATSWGGPGCNVQYSEFAGVTSAHNNGTMQTTANGNAISASTTYFWNYSGGVYNTAVAEATVQLSVPYALTLSQLRLRLASNTAMTATCTSRKNTADGNLVISVSSGASGEFADSTHSDSYVASDLIDAKFVTGTGTNMAFSSLRAQFDDGTSTGNTNYTDSVTETGSAADSSTAIQGQSATASESGSASDSSSAAQGYPVSDTETASAADSSDAAVGSGRSTSESASASDSPDGIVSRSASATETGSASDSSDAVQGGALSVTESASASDASSAAQGQSGSASESASASDSTSASTSIPASVSEATSAADHSTAVIVSVTTRNVIVVIMG